MANSAIVGILRALLTADTAQFDAAMKRSSASAQAWSRDLRTIGQQTTQLGTALTKTLTLPIVALAGASVKAAMDFEQSFANVRKTVGGSKPEMDAFAQSIRNMAKELPVTTEELNKIAALGGQMGVPISQLEKFTRHVAALGVAVDGISTDDAAAGLAQIGNATGTGTKNIAEMASALVHLGNKSNATEADILEFTKRLVGAGHSVGMTVPEIMALGTAMANVGINAESGGTAMSTVISKISKAVSEGGQSLEEFAKVSGKSAEEFAAIWRSSPIKAIDLFVKGLGTMRERGIDLNLTMGELGTEGIRVQDTLKRLSGAAEGVATSVGIANEGWQAGNKHLVEAEEKFKTTANQLKVLWNQIKDVGITIGNALLPAIQSLVKMGQSLIPVIDTLAKGFAALPGSIQLVILGIGALAAAIGPLLFVFGQLITATATVIGAFAKKGIASRALVAANETLAASNVTLGASFKALVPLIGAVTAVLAGLAVAQLIQSKAAKQYTDQFGSLAEVEAEIAKREAEIKRLRQDPDARREASVIQEHVDALKVKRDVLKQIVAEQTKANEAAVGGFEFQGPMPSGKSVQRSFAEGIKQANETIQKEIKNTGLSVSQLTAMLNENEAAFKAGAKGMGLNAEAVQFLEQQLQKQKKAATESKKATEDLNKAVDEQRKQLEALGIITRDSVDRQFKELNVLWSRAVAEGIPLKNLVQNMGPAYAELADKAKKSGVAVAALTETVALQKQLLEGARPKLDSLTLIGGGTESLMKLGAGIRDITAESLSLQAQQTRTNAAFKAFGLETPRDLQAAARAARDHFQALQESGLATAAQLKQAREKVLEAERLAAGETISIWKTQIFPNVKGVVDNLTSAINGSFAQMTLGAKSFKEGFVDIWESIKSAVLNIFNQILSAFVNQFLKGMTGALSGVSGSFGKAFSGLLGGGLSFGGAAAGAAVPGLATSTIGTGGGFAGGFGTIGGGLSGAAIAGLTAGIGAAVVAGLALYNRQNNVTAKSREAFAIEKGFKDLGALYKQLGTMGPRGEDLRHTGLNVIGRKDEAANRKWMEDVSKFMDSVQNFTTVVSSATGNIAAGFTGKLATLFKTQTESTLKAYDDQIEAAKDNAEEVKRLEQEKADFIKQTQATIVANTQVEFDRVSRITLGAFTAARAQGQSSVQAIQTVGAAIDTLKASADQFGFAGNAAYEELLKWRELTTVAAPILDQLAGVKDLLTILGDVGRLDQQMFDDLQQQGLAAYQSLIDAGFTEKQAREAVRPLIEEEIRLAKEKNLEIDKGTAALYKTMLANGEVKASTASLIDVFKEGFGALLKFLKVDLPTGWRDTAKAAGDAAAETESKWSRIRIKVPVRFELENQPEAPNLEFPGLATGGIVTSPRIVGVGEGGPEAIIPLSKLPGMVSGMPSIGEELSLEAHIHNYMDGRKTAEILIPHLKFAAKRVGVRPI